MQLLLAAIGGCSTIDIIGILKKQKQDLQDLQVDVDGDRRAAFDRARREIREARMDTRWVSTVHPTRSLAQQAGISAAYLSQIESGKRTGSAEVLAAIATALDLTLDEIV